MEVLVSLPTIHRRNSTAQLMDDFYASVAAGNSYADALRQAKLKMLHSHYRPYYRAPFQLYSRAI
jgi:CHAT domain-containing protein